MSPIDSTKAFFWHILNRAIDEGNDPGSPTPDELSELTNTTWWSNLEATDDSAAITTKTTFGVIGLREARRLLLRGYANTWLATLYMKPFDPTELAQPCVQDAVKRINSICGEPVVSGHK
jgi:hypothetical protein